MNIILFGPPGSGKGTQSKKIAERFNLIHISTGDLLREEIKNETELGKSLTLGTGILVDDEVVVQLVKNKINNLITSNVDFNAFNKGFIFDGFPRTVEQAIELTNFINIDKVLMLKVKDDEVIKRILKRGLEEKRSDDSSIEIARTRLVEYSTKTYPIKNYYRMNRILHVINGEGTVDDVFSRIKKILRRKEHE